MISGAHVIIYSADADADRAFIRDVLGFDGIDAGGGWMIFALPPSELAVHPADTGGRHELYFLCDDIDATISELKRKSVDVSSTTDEGWGLLTSVGLPSGNRVGLYQPKHPTAMGSD